jgi:hypothetical protein
MDKTTENAVPGPLVTDSRYFTNDFNTDIIDGPLRIYFSDRQEADALQIYFDIQETLAGRGLKLEAIPLDSPNMFLMLYPTTDSFKDAFEQDEKLAFGKFGRHLVLGINSPCGADTRELIGNQVKTIFAEALKVNAIPETVL